MISKPPPELSEKNFINEGYSKDPFPLWLWLFLLAATAALFWGGNSWYQKKMNTLFKDSPFLQVTNREISLFLWQNPESMRVNAKEKTGYLPAFQYIDKITIDLPQVDDFVVAPPELLFRYHTWKRLLAEEFIPRPIPKEEFVNFLSYAEEWDPAYWPSAPSEYIQMVKNLPTMPENDLSQLSQQQLPMPVRMAFEGWKNYFIEGNAINAIAPTVGEMQTFLSRYPHYARNFWRNLVMEHTPNYLKSLMMKDISPDQPLPPEEMSSFLRVAFFNDAHRLIPQSQSRRAASAPLFQ